MALNSVSGGNFNTPLLVADPVVVPGGSYPAQFTTVGGVRIPAAFEIKSTSGAFVPPRMTGVQAAALTPVSPAMTLYVEGGHTGPFAADGLYVRGAAGWNLIANSGNFNNVTVSNTDPENQFVVPVWSGTTNEIMSTGVTIENSDQLIGIGYVSTKLNPPTNFPIYGINPSNVFVSTEGIGSTGVGTLNFSASGAVQLEVTGTANTGNILRFTGSTSGNPASMSAVGVDGNISIHLAPKGTGQVRNNVGASNLPSYSFTGRTGDGMYSLVNGTLGFSAQGLRQVEIFGTGDGTNFLVFSGNSSGQPVELSATGADTDVSLAISTKGIGQVLTDSSGTSGAPIYSFRANPGDGLFNPNTGFLGLSTDGFMQVEIGNSGDGTNFLSLGGSQTAVALSITADGTDPDISLELNPKGLGQVLNSQSGSPDTPAYSFTDDPTTGIYRFDSGPNSVLGFSSEGAMQVVIAPSGDGTNTLALGGGSTGSSTLIIASGTDTDVPMLFATQGTGEFIFISDTASNGFIVQPSATGQPVVIAAIGSDTDVSLDIGTQGAGDAFLSNPNANFGVGITTFNSSSKSNISLLNGTAPSASVANTIQIFSTDLSAGNTTLGLWTEGTNVSNTVSVVATKNIAIVINGTTYYLMAKTIA